MNRLKTCIESCDYYKSTALIRLALGLVLLGQFLYNLDSISLFYGKNTMLYYPLKNTFLDLCKDYYIVFFSLYFSIIVAFIFGIGKRITILFLFSILVIKGMLFPEHLNWGDYILRYQLLFLSFTNSFVYLSYRKSKIQQQDNLHTFGVAMLMAHLVFIFISNVFYKLQSPEWLSGDSLYLIIKSSTFVPLSIKELLLTSPLFLKIGTWITLLLQFIFPFMVFSKYKGRFLGIMFLLHLFIGLLFLLLRFQLILIVGFSIFLSDKHSFYDKIKWSSEKIN